MKPVKKLFPIIKDAVAKFIRDRAFRDGATISYYTIFSLPAIIIIIVELVGSFLGEAETRKQVLLQIEEMIGTDSASAVGEMISNISVNEQSGLATLIGIGALLFGATGTFYSLRYSLNEIWNVRVKPEGAGGLIRQIFDRILSLAMVLTLGFILLVSMLLETLLVAVNRFLNRYFDELSGWSEESFPKLMKLMENLEVIYIITISIQFLFSLLVISVVFGLIFKFLSDAKIRWKDSMRGGLFSAVLFSIGKSLLGWYIGTSNLASTYGAAGSLVIIMLWVYFSSLVLLLGAEFIYVYTADHGRDLEAKKLARRISVIPIHRLKNRLQSRRKKVKLKEAPEPEENLPDSQ